MAVSDNLTLLLAGLLIEASFGYPDRLFRAVGHPVTWMGALIGWLDRALNRDGAPDRERRLNGVVALALVLLVTAAVAVLVERGALASLPLFAAVLLLGALASSLIAQRSLDRHVAAVAEALEREGLARGRAAVSRIVGRNPAALDEAGVARAAMESLAENFSDGVVAPAFWCAVAGLPGISLYKAVNTADSMIGHKTPRHLAFGWAAARLDDLVNLPASRLAALWLIIAAAHLPDCQARGAWRAVWRDARHHKSPNAGWPEAALAGALGLRLNGPKVYGDIRREDAWMGDGRAEATPGDIRRALSLYRLACAVQAFAIVLLLLAVSVLA
ncbi:adenosylcobinamide-phosphate synthase CbiB [Rhodoligotrophos defluvii]|uniref:adenosylcobinamide-phosphate synthase CbiB n=1 Tax=Rhodoligotrophos defluvii TaxID=2561934 RepID=UPI0010C9DD73|nr:adenosylcobinamide-phosphate synthase CbiB [Rhodoligotrophos defluvii]